MPNGLREKSEAMPVHSNGLQRMMRSQLPTRDASRIAAEPGRHVSRLALWIVALSVALGTGAAAQSL